MNTRINVTFLELFQRAMMKFHLLIVLSLVLPINALAVVGANWATETSGSTRQLQGVAHNGTLYVAVGESTASGAGAILTSNDGVTWTPRSAASVVHLKDVVWCGTKFVAVGQNAVGINAAGSGITMTSVDGITWSAPVVIPTTNTRDLLGIASSGSIYVAVGSGGTIIQSSDAITWNNALEDGLGGLEGVTWGNGLFVVVGKGSRILTSPDGLTWTERNPNTQGNPWLSEVAWGGTTFVAAGENGAVMTSADGITWTTRTSGETRMFDGLAWDGSQFIAVGGPVVGVMTAGRGMIYTSADGITWSKQVDVGPITGFNHLWDVIWTGHDLITVGDSGLIMRSTSNMAAWAIGTSGSTRQLQGVAHNGTLYVAVGESTASGAGAVLTSSDGVTWTPRSAASVVHLKDVAWSGTKFVAVGQNAVGINAAGSGITMNSVDGITWSAPAVIPTTNTRDLLGVASNGNTYVAVGSGGTIIQSSDGVTWNNTLEDGLGGIEGVAWGNGLYTAVGKGSRILTSPDGLIWTERNPNTPGNPWLSEVVWGGSTFVAAGENGAVMTSADGITWTTRTSGETRMFDGLAWDGSQFVAVGGPITDMVTTGRGMIYTSADGITWSKQIDVGPVTGLNHLWDVTWTGHSMVAVGDSGLVVHSASNVASVQPTINNQLMAAARTLVLGISTSAGVAASQADLYLALQLPDGTLLVMQPDGSFAATIAAKTSNWMAVDSNQNMFTYTLTGNEPAGTYTWMAGIAETGTFNFIGGIRSITFTVN